VATKIKGWAGLGLSTVLLGSTALAGLEARAETTTDSGAFLMADAGEGKSGEHGEHGEASKGEKGEGGEGEAGEKGEASGGEQGEAAPYAGEGEGEGGEGEGGEGGIDISKATSDPAVYLSGLAVVEAHVLAAKDAYAAGETQAAAEMFAHPVSEVLIDMEPAFEELGVEPFDNLMMSASDGAIEKLPQQVIDERTEAILTALQAAAKKAPKSDAKPGIVQAKVVADQIERAVNQYSVADDTDALEPYLDGYGFYQTAVALYERSGSQIKSADADIAGDIDAALDQLKTAYPTASRPAELEADKGSLYTASSKLQLALSGK